MNDFDLFLEHKLGQMLDPVVAVQPPARRGRIERTRPTLAVVPPAADTAGVEPVPLTVVVTSLS